MLLTPPSIEIHDSPMDPARILRLSRLRRADPYLALPEAVRYAYSRDEWMWLTDEQKANLIDSECTPWHETP